MSKTATLKGKITLDDTEFHKALRRAADRAKKFGGDVASAVGGAALKAGKYGLLSLGAAGVGAAGGLLAAAKAAADLGGQLSDAAAVTGVSADKMLVLQQAFANAGMSGDSAAGIIAKLQAAIGKSGMLSEEAQDKIDGYQETIDELKNAKDSVGLDPKEIAKINKQIAAQQDKIKQVRTSAKGAAQALQELGLNQKALAQMEGADQLEAVLAALARVGNQTQKMAFLKMLKLPPELMTLANDPNAFKGARDMLGSLVPIMGKFAGEFDRVSDIIGAKPGILFKQVGAGFLQAIVDNPALQKALSWFEKLDVAPIGAAIGERVSGLVNFITATIESGNISETISGALQTGFAYAMDYLLQGMGLVMATIGGVMQGLFSEHGAMFVSGFGAALTGVLVVAAFNFSKLLLAAWYGLEAKFADSGIGKVLSAARTGAGVVGMATSAVPSLFFDGAKDMLKSSAAMTYGGYTDLVYGKDRADLSMRQTQALNDQNINIFGATQAEVLGDSTRQVGESLKGLVGVLTDLPENIRSSYKTLNVDAIRRPSADNAAATAGGFIRTLSQDQKSGLLQMINGGPGVNRFPQNRPQPEWIFPRQSSQGSKPSDTKQVIILEQVASLLERNLTAMQVA